MKLFPCVEKRKRTITATSQNRIFFLLLFLEKWKNEIAEQLPELPDERKEKLISKYNLPEYDAEILTQSKALVDYFENVASFTGDFKAASNWVMGDVLKVINEKKLDIKDFPILPDKLAKLINLIKEGIISGKIAKDIFPLMLLEGNDPEVIVHEKNLVQISEFHQLKNIVEKIIESNHG